MTSPLHPLGTRGSIQSWCTAINSASNIHVVVNVIGYCLLLHQCLSRFFLIWLYVNQQSVRPRCFVLNLRNRFESTCTSRCTAILVNLVIISKSRPLFLYLTVQHSLRSRCACKSICHSKIASHKTPHEYICNIQHPTMLHWRRTFKMILMFSDDRT